MVFVGLAVATPVTADPGALARTLHLVEALDADPLWSAAWVGDSVLGLPAYDSAAVVAALAARTSRIRLGVSGMASLGLRQPIVVAHQWATVDVLSGGRVTLVGAAGNRTGTGHERELAAFGLTFDEKVERFEATVRFLREASLTGRLPVGDGVELRPGFVQRPIPLWVVANPGARADEERVARTLGRVARLGDGWLTYNLTPEVLARRVGLLDGLLPPARRTAVGQPDVTFPVAVQLNVHVAARRQDAREATLRYWETRRMPRGLDRDRLDEVCAVGTADDVVAFAARLVDAGATHLTLFPLAEDAGEQVRRLRDEVLPALVALPARPRLAVAPWTATTHVAAGAAPTAAVAV